MTAPAANDRSTDLATDLGVALLLGTGAACWSGLVLGQLGWFRPLPVAGLGIAVLLASLRVLGASRGPAGGARLGWRSLDGPAVFLLAAVLYGPAYDTTLYGADATVYLGSGAHLARTGSLAVDDELLRRLPRLEQLAIFGAYGVGRDDPLDRSPAGLVFQHFAPPVYSTFSQLPSVWLAIGFGMGGLTGALLATPLLAAAGVMAFYLVVRRLGGVPAALLAAALLAPALPQVSFARLPMGESGAQFLLWGGLLACGRWADARSRLAAVAAGAGIGLAALARPEYALFVPLALAFLYASRGPAGRLPATVPAVAAALIGHAVVLILVVVPTHYRIAIRDTLTVAMGLVTDALGHPARLALGAVAAVLVLAAILAVGRRRGSAVGWWVRVAAAIGLVFWGLVYIHVASPGSLGQGVPRLRSTVGWPVLVLGPPGLLILGRSWWRDTAGRLAFLLGVISAVHFLYDPHTGPLAVWGMRRLLPAALPLLFAASATALVATGRLWRPAALLGGAIALVLNAWPARALWGRPYLKGANAAAADIASLVPPGAIVLVSAGIGDALLDVPLLLIHGRSAVQLRTLAGDVRPLRQVLRAAGDRPLYLLEHGLLPPPRRPGLRFEPAGERSAVLLLPRPQGRAAAGLTYSRLRVKAFRVEPIRRGRTALP